MTRRAKRRDSKIQSALRLRGKEFETGLRKRPVGANASRQSHRVERDKQSIPNRFLLNLTRARRTKRPAKDGGP